MVVRDTIGLDESDLNEPGTRRLGTPMPSAEKRVDAARTARERILEAAAALFSRDGVRAVGVNAVIERAGVARATFYRHFRSKEDLIAAWLHSEHARWLDRIKAEAKAKAADRLEELDAFLQAVADDVSGPGYCGCPYLNTGAELWGPTSPVSPAIADYLMEVETYLGDLATAAGLRSPRALAIQLRLLLAGTMSTARALGQPYGVTEAVTAARVLIDAAR
jgi:AcrR family transcriptional regulator